MASHRRSDFTRKPSTEYFIEIKPSNQEDLDKDALLFPDQNEYKPEYLELPIQLEGNMRLNV